VDERAVINLLEERSEEAISELSRLYGSLLLSLARSIVGNREDAEECVNDAYLTIWNTVPTMRPDSLKAYACGIVRNLALKRYTYNHADKRMSNEPLCYEELEEILPTTRAVEEGIQAEELADCIRCFLEKQNEYQKQLFVRRYWCNESYTQLSEETGLNESTLRTQLTRMRRRLKKWLINKGFITD
jgi:RNA polymerase sigma-70 factor (ECF subfamily)